MTFLPTSELNIYISNNSKIEASNTKYTRVRKTTIHGIKDRKSKTFQRIKIDIKSKIEIENISNNQNRYQIHKSKSKTISIVETEYNQ